MEMGGAWLGFHAAGYNDKDTNWPWFVDSLGGAVFHINSGPPLPAKLVVDDRAHPVTMNLPVAYVSPVNEWYVWKPSPRLNPDEWTLRHRSGLGGQQGVRHRSYRYAHGD